MGTFLDVRGILLYPSLREKTGLPFVSLIEMRIVGSIKPGEESTLEDAKAFSTLCCESESVSWPPQGAWGSASKVGENKPGSQKGIILWGSPVIEKLKRCQTNGPSRGGGVGGEPPPHPTPPSPTPTPQSTPPPHQKNSGCGVASLGGFSYSTLSHPGSQTDFMIAGGGTIGMDCNLSWPSPHNVKGLIEKYDGASLVTEKKR